MWPAEPALTKVQDTLAGQTSKGALGSFHEVHFLFTAVMTPADMPPAFVT